MSGEQSAAQLLERLAQVRKEKAAVDRALRKRQHQQRHGPRDGAGDLDQAAAPFHGSQSRPLYNAGTAHPAVGTPMHKKSIDVWEAYRQTELAALAKEKEEIRARKKTLYADSGLDKLSTPDAGEIQDVLQKAKDHLPELKANAKRLRDMNYFRFEWIQDNYGPGTYEAWQLPDYRMVRSLVREVLLPRVLSRCHSSPEGLDLERKQHEEQVQSVERRDRNRKKTLFLKQQVASLVDEIVREKALEVSKEVLAISMWSHQIGRTLCISAANNHVLPEDKAGLAWRDAILKRIPDAENHMTVHSQQISIVSGDEAIKISKEAVLLSWKHLLPVMALPYVFEVDRPMPEDIFFDRAEIQYWKHFKSSPNLNLSLPVPGKQPAVLALALSATGERLAVAFADGSVAVWGMQTLQPSHLCSASPSFGLDGREAVTVSLAWDADGRLVAGLGADGSLKVWSTATVRTGTAGSVASLVSTQTHQTAKTKRTLKSVFTRKSSQATLPAQELLPLSLILHHGREALSQSFSDDDQVSILIWPASEIFNSTTETLAVGLSSGTILQLLVDVSSGQLRKQVAFKCHKAPLLFVDFVKNQPIMVSMDRDGVICKWLASSSCQNVRGWFAPLTVHRLDLLETVLVHLPDQDKEIFSDKKRAKRTSRQIVADREKAEEYLARLQLSDLPWHSVTTDTLMLNIINPLAGQPDRRTVFYTITRLRKNAALSQLVEEVYEPQTGKEAILLAAAVDPSSHLLVVALLCEDMPPKEPHITLVQLSLTDLGIVAPRIDVTVSMQQWEKLHAQKDIKLSISDQVLLRGSRYAVIDIAGSVMILSLATGLIVASAMDPQNRDDDAACALSAAQAKLPDKCTCLGVFQNLACLGIASFNSSRVTILQLANDLTYADTRHYREKFTDHSYNIDQPHIQRQHPPLHCLHFTLGDSSLPGPTELHRKMKLLVLSLVERAVSQSARSSHNE